MTEMTKYLTADEEQILLDAACGGDVNAPTPSS